MLRAKDLGAARQMHAYPCCNAEMEATEKCYAKEASHKEGRRTRLAFGQPSPAFSCKNKGALCSGHLQSSQNLS